MLACTPNGAVCFISPLYYVGSISDVQLTKVSGFVTQLKDKPGIQIMANKGFTIKDILKELDIELNIPSFLKDGKMSPSNLQKCRKIASLRIHVERAIGRLKKYAICKQTIPISLSRLVNQIVCVCAYLSNFQPVSSCIEADLESDSCVEDYFNTLSSCSDVDSDLSTDTEY